MNFNSRELKILILAVAVLVGMGMVACTDTDTAGKKDVAKGISDEEMGIRKKTLFDEEGVKPATGSPPEAGPGTSEKLARSFENAPPLIPHDITGMLPIATTNNMCLGCHMPKAAVSSGAVAIPKTHFTNLMTGEDLKGELHGERYNCMQCHVQQVEVPVVVDNIFKEEFTEERMKYNSNLASTLDEGVK